MVNDARFPKLPSSNDPAADNAKAIAAVKAIMAPQVPIPFLLAILAQESGLQQFKVPSGKDEDNFIVVGCDHNDQSEPRAITSRGYGIGQYTLFHHPPRPEEVVNLMLDPVRNAQRAVNELLDKFNNFVVSAEPSSRADDRYADHGAIALRHCQYESSDAKGLRDCRACLQAAGAETIEAGVTPLYRGSTEKFEPTEYHKETRYEGVPKIANVRCDWPYAVRRYNGSGMNSYHYQVEVALRVVKGV